MKLETEIVRNWKGVKIRRKSFRIGEGKRKFNQIQARNMEEKNF